MNCFHIEQVALEIELLASKIGDYNSSIYHNLSEIVNKRDIGQRSVLTKKGVFQNDYHTVTTYKTYDFHYVPDIVLLDSLSRLSNLLKDCNCHQGNKNKQITNEKRLVLREN